MKWAELPLEANVSKWAVTVLNLDRMRRHLDRATLNMFWEVLDKYVFTGRPLSFIHCCINAASIHFLEIFTEINKLVLSIQSKSNNGLTLYQEVILLSQILITTDNDDFLLKLFQVHGKREASFAILIGDCGCILLTVNI